MRYFLLKDIETLEVFVSNELDEQPTNSIEYYEHGFVNPVFNQYPNPTSLIEGDIKTNILEVPFEVYFWRVRMVLKFMDLEEPIANAIPDLEEPIKTMVNYIWQNNINILVERHSQTLLFLQSVLQLTDQQVDEIFIEANGIQI